MRSEGWWGAGANLVENTLHQVARDNADDVRQLARELGLPPRLRVVGDVG